MDYVLAMSIKSYFHKLSRLRNKFEERDILHAVNCKYTQFEYFKIKATNELQLKVVVLKQGDIILLSLVKGLLSNEES